MNTSLRDQTKGRTIAIGLDSFDINLIEKWADEGYLPCFKYLLETCPLAELDSAGDILQGSVYASLITGVSPGQHGLYLSTQLIPGSYETGDFSADHVRLDPFYKLISDHGIGCAVVDVPSDRPLDSPNLFQVIDWGTEFKYSKFTVVPRNRKNNFIKRFGFHPLTNYPGTKTTQKFQCKLRNMLEKGIKQKTSLSQYLLKQNDLDFIFIYSCESHKAGHFFWKYWDEQYVDFESSDPYLKDALRRIYQALDQHVQKIVESLMPADNLLVFSEHGMKATYRGTHFTETVLERLGLLVRTGSDNAQSKQPALRNGKRRIWEALPGSSKLREVGRAVLPTSLKMLLRPSFRKAIGELPDPDWTRTSAFVLPTDRNSYIRINLRGREPQGIVDPGDGYEEMLKMINREFRNLVDPSTGKPVVEDVCFLRKLFPGSHEDDLPDISIRWCSDGPIWSVQSQSIGLAEQELHELRSGNHRKQGFLLVRGPAFRLGPSRHKADLLQIAPTILSIFQIDKPSNYEMGPIQEILA